MIRATAVDKTPARVERCSRCGAGFDRAAWRLLTVVQRVDPPEIQHSLLNWPAGLLLQAPALTGPWTTNTAAVSPYTIPISSASGNQFFRVLVNP